MREHHDASKKQSSAQRRGSGSHIPKQSPRALNIEMHQKVAAECADLDATDNTAAGASRVWTSFHQSPALPKNAALAHLSAMSHRMDCGEGIRNEVGRKLASPCNESGASPRPAFYPIHSRMKP